MKDYLKGSMEGYFEDEYQSDYDPLENDDDYEMMRDEEINDAAIQ